MDPQRRELYVEGRHDRAFLKYVVGDSLDPNAAVVEIDQVDMPDVDVGGNRGRLLAFAQLAAQGTTSIKVFADADLDRMLGRQVPTNVWLTDGRDLEGYLLRHECIRKIWCLALSADEVPPESILSPVNALARQLGFLRLTSALDGLDLPFQNTDLAKYVSIAAGSIHLDFEGYVKTLLQKRGISLSQHESIVERVGGLAEEHAAFPDTEIVHGKDAFTLIGEFLRVRKVSRDDADRIIRTSFECSLVPDDSSLAQVIGFLRGE